MIRNTTLALVAALAMAATSHAAIIITKATAPTNPGTPPTLGGYQTDTLTATDTDGTEKIIGFDFVGNGSNFGFLGAMNQVNPLGSATVFNDNNTFFPFVTATPDQDSQFQVKSTDGIAINPSESANSLKAAFNYSASNIATLAQPAWAFVHIAHNVLVTYNGTLTVRDANGNDRLVPISGDLPVPEPATLSLLGLAMVGGLGFIRRRSA